MRPLVVETKVLIVVVPKKAMKVHEMKITQISFEKFGKKSLPDSDIVEALAHGYTTRSSPNYNHVEAFRWRWRRSQGLEEENEKPGKDEGSRHHPQIHQL